MSKLQALKNIRRSKYNFKDTIARHMQGKLVVKLVDRKLVPPGKYVTEEREVEILGSIVHLTNDDLMNDNGGHYTNNTRKLYCYEYLEEQDKIKYTTNLGEEREYTILERYDKSDYDDGLFIYFVEGVTND